MVEDENENGDASRSTPQTPTLQPSTISHPPSTISHQPFMTARKPPGYSSEPHGREAAVDVIRRPGDEAPGGPGEKEDRGAHQLVGLAEPGHRRAPHDLLHAGRGEELAARLRRDETRREAADL